MTGKVGIGVITCNRESLYQQCVTSIPEVDIVIVVNDGKPYTSKISNKINKYIQHDYSMGVGRSKNEALRYLLASGCRHIFLCEDDVAIVDPSVCAKYINAAEASGILHLNFGYHGPANKKIDGTPNFKKMVTYNDDVSISFHRHLAGAFSYYSALVLEKVGFIDETYHNAYDHLDHTIAISEAGFHPSFGWFADVAQSNLLIRDLDEDLSRSVIRKSKNIFRIRYRLYSYYFKYKHGYFVEDMPIVSETELEEQLHRLKEANGKRIEL